MPGGCYSAADSDDAKARREAGGDTAWNRWSKLIAVCLVVLCVVLLIVVIVLSIENKNLRKVDLEREKETFLKLGWKNFSSSFYIIINGQKNWTESRQNCSKSGADLVIITSREEQEFVNNLGGGKRAWIGLNKRENKWKWVNGKTLITGFWGSGEPNIKDGDEGCVIIGDATDPVLNWADDPCNKPYNWICEKIFT